MGRDITVNEVGQFVSLVNPGLGSFHCWMSQHERPNTQMNENCSAIREIADQCTKLIYPGDDA